MIAITIVGGILALAIVLFIISCILYWCGRQKLLIRILRLSPVFMIIMTALLIIALFIDGFLFNDISQTKYF